MGQSLTFIPPHRGWRLRGLVALGAVVLLAGTGSVVWKLRLPGPPSPLPSDSNSHPVEIGVGALGRLEPGWKVYQVAPASAAEGARVDSLMVEEGDWVARGAIVAVLDTHARREAALKEARALVQVSQAKLALVQAGVKADEVAAQTAFTEQLRAALSRAEADLKRVASVRANRAISAEEYDQKDFQAQIARATLRQAESSLAAMKLVRPEDVLVAEAELAKAEAGVARAEADLAVTTIRSPINGRILKVHARPGERVGDAGIVEIGNTLAMHAVAEVYELDVSRIRIGQKARVWVQSLPDELKGEVVHIGWKVGRRVVLDNDPVKDTDARVVEVRIQLDAPSNAQVEGLSYARVDVRIHISEDH